MTDGTDIGPVELEAVIAQLDGLDASAITGTLVQDLVVASLRLWLEADPDESRRSMRAARDLDRLAVAEFVRRLLLAADIEIFEMQGWHEWGAA
jgi:hypothetical protein